MSLIGLSGAILVMIAHGFLAALCFALSGYLWDQKKTLEMEQYGGLLRQAPFVGALLVMAMMAGCGLPGFANFAGEVTVLFGAWDSLSGVVVGTAWGALVIGALYALRAVRRLLHGPIGAQSEAMSDLPHYWAKLPYVLLVGCLLIFGIFPGLLTEKIRGSMDGVVATMEKGLQQDVILLANDTPEWSQLED